MDKTDVWVDGRKGGRKDGREGEREVVCQNHENILSRKTD
jgi:hypothetical protein